MKKSEKIIEIIKKKSVNSKKKIILPEAEDKRIIGAAKKCIKKKYAIPVLVGKNIKKIKGAIIINPEEDKNFEKYAKLYSKKTKIPLRTAKFIVKDSLIFSTLALANGDVDGMVGGCVYSSGDFITSCLKILNMEKGIKNVSSFFIMDIPRYNGGENGTLIYADPSVNPNPSSKALADIAVCTGNSVKKLLNWKPKIAMLSFSTKGSADHPDVNKVIEAGKIAKRKSKYNIEYELQADSALVLSTAKKKIKGKSKVAGKANILIFPDLDAANISYKLTQILTNGYAYGPILQGFNKPVSDLSRGAKVEDIIGSIASIALMAKRWKNG